MSILKSVLLPVVVGLAVCRGAAAEEFQPEEIVALERASLDRWKNGDTQGFVDLFVPEMTYFDPSVKARVDGLEAMKKLMASIHGTFTIPRYEIIAPKVQRHGDTAVLTFNLVNYDKAGQVTSRWNSTGVYCRIGGRWKVIHSHWSKTAP